MKTDARKADGDDVEFHLPDAEAPERRHVGPYFHPQQNIPTESVAPETHLPSDAGYVEETAPQSGAEYETFADEAPREVLDVPDGPPPSDKVDFENLPEFVWQRTMLKTVRLIAIFVALVIAIVLLIAFFGMGKGAHDSLKPIIEGEPPVTPQQP